MAKKARKHMKRALVAIMIVSLAMGLLPINVYADGNDDLQQSINSTVSETSTDADGNNVTTTTTTTQDPAGNTVVDIKMEITEDKGTTGTGTLEDPQVKTTETTTTENTTVTDPAGNSIDLGTTTTTTTTTDTQASGTDADGAEVVFQETESNSKLTEADGTVLKESGSEKGSEQTTTTTTSSSSDTQTQNSPGTPSIKETEGQPVYDEAKTENISGSSSTDTTYPDLTTNLEGTTVTVTPGETVTEEVKPTVNWNPPAECDETAEDNGVKVTTKVTHDKDKDGNVIGYHKTVTTVSSVDGQPVSTTGTVSSDSVDSGSSSGTTTETKPSGNLTRPEEILPTPDGNGNTIQMTVEDKLDEKGQVIGYTTTTTVTDENGKVIRNEVETVTEMETTKVTTEVTTTTTDTTTIVTTTTVTPTTLTTVTETTNAKLEVKNGKVTATMGDVEEGEDHGETKTAAVNPDTSRLENIAVGKTDTDKDLYHRADKAGQEANTGNADAPDGYSYQWLGEYGEESAVRIHAGTGTYADTWQAHQFVLVDVENSNNKQYVYCADFEVSPVDGYYYKMENLEDAVYYTEEEAKHIRAIVTNGYIGTSGKDENGEWKMGSLEAMKKSLKAKGQAVTGLSNAQIDSLTEGEALAATQAAIWKYGNSGNTMLQEDPVGRYYDSGNFDADYENATVKALYKYLIGLTEESTETDLVKAEDLSAKITVTGKNMNDSRNTNQDKTDDVYSGEVSFSMTVTPNNQNDDLIVTVYRDGQAVATRRLAGDDSATGYGVITADANGVYKIEGLELTEGVTINLSLTGTQNIDKGVYIFTSETIQNQTSQTFVGVAEGKRTVDMNVDLTFSVEEPTAAVTATNTSNTEIKHGTVTDVTETTTVDRKVVVQTDITTEVVVEKNESWEKSWEKEYTYNHDPQPLNDDGPIEEKKEEKKQEEKKPEEKKEETVAAEEEQNADMEGSEELYVLLDEEIPLAAVPKTGDASVLWLVLAGLSGMGAAGMGLTGRKRKENK